LNFTLFEILFQKGIFNSQISLISDSSGLHSG
jgi:hypothetical protein